MEDGADKQKVARGQVAEEDAGGEDTDGAGTQTGEDEAMSGRRAKALRRQVYGPDLSTKRSARGTKTVTSFAKVSYTITCDARRTAYQHTKRKWKRRGAPGPSPARTNRRAGRIPYWATQERKQAAWRKNQ